MIPDSPFLVIPEVSSERRDYIPIGWLEPPIIPSNKIRILTEATLGHFGLFTSAMHMSWVRHISGRLKSDYQYGIGVVYNTFPLPTEGLPALASLHDHTQTVLDARAGHPDASLAALYDPDGMPVSLRRAHTDLDRAVERLYRRSAFDSDSARAEHLLALYEKLTVQ